MKKLIAALFVALAAVPSHAAYQGKLDLGQVDPAAIAFRDLQNGVWRVGAQTQIWHLQNTATGNEVFHVSGYWATRLEGQETVYGPSVGVNVGQAAAAFIDKIELLVPAVQSVTTYVIPPFVSKLSDWTSVEVYGGYSPIVGGGDKPWAYGVGGKVVIPLSELYKWAAGTQASGDGVKGL